MDLYSFAPIAAVLDLAYSFVVALADAITPLAGVSATALAIVALTLMVRTALIPVGISQVRAELTRKRIAPQLQALQRRYTKNPQLLQQKTLELYRAEKASPFAGMLPALLQAPVLSIVYGLFVLGTINGHPNGLLTEALAGVPLGDSLFALLGGGAAWPGLLVHLGLLGVLAAVAAVSRLVARRFAPVQPDATPAMQRMAAWLGWLPFLTVVFAAVVPLAAAIYLTVSTMWTLVERVLLRRVLGRTVSS